MFPAPNETDQADGCLSKGIPRPFVKWVGGKRQLLGTLLRLVPSDFAGYHEPFMGGGALFFALARMGRLRLKPVHLSDLNAELIGTYQSLQKHPLGVIECLQQHRYDKEHFYRVRELDPTQLGPEETAARMIFLNHTGFNGLFRVNSKNKFNVPFGRYKNPRFCDPDNLRAVSAVLKGVSVNAEGFEQVRKRARAGDFVYFDPPYVPLSPTANFVGYAKGGFSLTQQKLLAETFTQLAARGVQVMLSNSDTPWVRDAYRGFRLVEVSARRRVNTRADRRGPIGELVVLSYPPERSG